MTNKLKQVDAPHYDFVAYVGKGRWNSYYHQIVETLSFKPASVLEIGLGPGIFRHLMGSMNIDCRAIDIAEDLHPDYVGSVHSLPFSDLAFDVVDCFQVLEHLPFEEFETALRELFRVARKGVVISLPDAGRTIKVAFPIHRNKVILLNDLLSRKKIHVFKGEHYWEINKRGYELKKILGVIENVGAGFGYRLSRHYRVVENPHHHFFVLTAAAAS